MEALQEGGTITDVLRVIAIVLGAAVVLALAGVLLLQQYIVYTENGPRLELPPFLQMLRREDPDGSASLPDPGSVSVVEMPPDGSGSEPEQEKAGFALSLPVSDVTDGSAGAKLEQAGAEALILEVKDRKGRLAWLSEQAVAERSGVNGTRAEGDALRAWNAGEVYTVARVCCFRDDSAPYYHNALALRRGEGNWRDELGLRWLSPAQSRSQAYIAGLCGELAELGFDEIVLEQFSFPTRGKTENINRGDSYDPARFAGQLEQLLTQAQQAAEPYGAKISLRVEGDALADGGALSGITAGLLERAYRLWSDEEGLQALSALEMGEDRERLVRIVDRAGEDSELFQAVIPAQEGDAP